MRCGSIRHDYLSWNGQVESRRYELDDTYITNARLLDDDVSERRRYYRAELIKQLRLQKVATEMDKEMADAG